MNGSFALSLLAKQRKGAQDMLQSWFEKVLSLLENQALSNILSVVGAVISGIVSLVVHILRGRRRGKLIACELLKVELLQTRPPYTTIHRVVWRIWNAGDETIEAWHYRSLPIEFSFGTAATVLFSHITDAKPDDLAVHNMPPSVHSNVSRLNPVCLNKKNSITLEFEVADITIDQVKLSLRISGNDTIYMHVEHKKFIKRAKRFRNGALAMFCLWLITIGVRSLFPSLSVMSLVSIVLTFLITLLITLCIINYSYAFFPK